MTSFAHIFGGRVPPFAADLSTINFRQNHTLLIFPIYILYIRGCVILWGNTPSGYDPVSVYTQKPLYIYAYTYKYTCVYCIYIYIIYVVHYKVCPELHNDHAYPLSTGFRCGIRLFERKKYASFTSQRWLRVGCRVYIILTAILTII